MVKRNRDQILWNAVSGDFHSFTILRVTSLIVGSDIPHLLISSMSSVGSSARSGLPYVAASALTSIASAIFFAVPSLGYLYLRGRENLVLSDFFFLGPCFECFEGLGYSEELSTIMTLRGFPPHPLMPSCFSNCHGGTPSCSRRNPRTPSCLRKKSPDSY